MDIIKAIGIKKTYNPDKVPVHALRGVDLIIKKGEFTAIVGPSGSGKTTLLNAIGGLDRPDEGSIIVNDVNISELNDNQLINFRKDNIGFVFQSFNLLPRATALANVELPMRYAVLNGRNRKQVAKDALEAVGLADRITHRPNELSGGQMQRVAIARALVNNPAIIMADEPTGNLDSQSGDEIMALLKNLNKERGTTLIIVTHDPEIAALTNRVISIWDGRIAEKI